VAIATWSSLSADSANLATPLNGTVDGVTVFIADIVNETLKNLYLGVYFQSGSMTPSASGSLALILRRKRGNGYTENNSEFQGLPALGTGTRQVSLQGAIRIPNAGTWGLYITNRLGTSIPNSGNTLIINTWNEEVN
jgi:hypothetical protein